MSISLGIDVGAVSVKLAALGGPEDTLSLAGLADSSPAFFLPQLPPAGGQREHSAALSVYRRLQSNPVQAVSDLLRKFYQVVPQAAVAGIRLTGSGAGTVARALDLNFENEFCCLARSMRALYPQVRTVFEIGGETSKYIRLGATDGSNHTGILDYQTSTDCAAGTGSFIDQQASRLLYAVEDVGAAACGAPCAARVAGRCSVFAKSDMIHAQQKGFSADQILRGLCEAVARNFKSSILKGRHVVPPVAFVGGVAANAGVRDALRDIFKLQGADFLVPELHCWMTALGASMLAAESTRKSTAPTFSRLQAEPAGTEALPSTEALSLAQVTRFLPPRHGAPTAVSMPTSASTLDP
jgi:activator of 2-hydroxyglutaryl-CoA dehydratase